MATEARYGWELPDLGDVADGPFAFDEFAKDVSATIADPSVVSFTPTFGTLGSGARQPTFGGTRQGQYQIRHGFCNINVFVDYGTNLDGGTGQLYVNLPVVPAGGVGEQLLICKTYSPGLGNFIGWAYVNPGVARAYPYFMLPAAFNGAAAPWQNAEINAGIGTGVPRGDGIWGTALNGNFVMTGRYYVG